MDLRFGPQQINVCLNESQFWTTANSFLFKWISDLDHIILTCV